VKSLRTRLHMLRIVDKATRRLTRKAKDLDGTIDELVLPRRTSGRRRVKSRQQYGNTVKGEQK
jgi:hypothetical protein